MTTSEPSSRVAIPAPASRGLESLSHGGPHGDGARPGQVGQRGRAHEAAAVDDHDVIDGMGDLGEQVAGHDDGPAFGGQAAQQVTEPPHAGGVEAVRGLVEHEDRWSPSRAVASPSRWRMPSE